MYGTSNFCGTHLASTKSELFKLRAQSEVMEPLVISSVALMTSYRFSELSSLMKGAQFRATPRSALQALHSS